ncbi:MAG TPA: carboxypeptidase-like regulatory domain-containing protein [Candidatus Thermoplasmatota archaeon]|nr:carboxypeptidase-like regulatory domain-containing protein [Candidatus Thermoplasmatota archaeon]
MRTALLAALVVLLLSGCTSSGNTGTTSDTGQFSDKTVTVSSTTGAIRGIVVDQAVTPIAKVAVSVMVGATNKTTTSDAQGRFVFSDLPAGTYFMVFKHLLYKTVQQSVDVKAGVADPPITKVLMEAVFAQKPYHEQFKFKGIIACGYNAVLVTAPCVTDYTSISPTCPGGCAPQLKGAQGDNRAFITSVAPNWQTIVTELTFQSNGQGTSDRMGVLVSYEKRTAGDWFGTAEGLSPIVLRLETGVEGPDQQGEPKLIPPEGRNDLQILGSIAAAEGQDAGVGINQEFLVFQTNFYNAKPPEGWSFAKGNEFPF